MVFMPLIQNMLMYYFFYSVRILDTKFVGFRGSYNNEIFALQLQMRLSIVALFRYFTIYVSLTTICKF